MRSAQQPFGKRAPLRIHGGIALNSRRRAFCSVIVRRNDVVYLTLAEDVAIPFRFRVEFEFDGSWLDCEFKSQLEGTIVAQVIGTSAQKNAQKTALLKGAPSLDEIEKWKGTVK